MHWSFSSSTVRKEVNSPTSPTSPTSGSEETVQIPTSEDPEEKKAIDALIKEIKDLKLDTPSTTPPEDESEDLKRIAPPSKKPSDVEIGSEMEKLLGEAVEATAIRQFPKAKDDPELKFLAVAVLRFRHYDIKSATDRLVRYLDWRVKNDVVHQDITKDTKLQAQVNEKVLRFLPTRDKYGRGIFVVNMKNNKPKKYTAMDVVRTVHWNLYSALKSDPLLQKNGLVVINDLIGTSHHNVDLNIPKHLFPLFTKIFPARIGGIFIVNPSPLLAVMVPMYQRFSPKLAKRLHIYGTNYGKLLRNFDKDALLEEHGGTLKLDYDAYLSKVMKGGK